MNVRQIGLFIENRAGRLRTVAQRLGDAGIDIRALSLADTSDFGILRLIVNRTDEAVAVLKQAGFTLKLAEVVAAEIPDRAGGLAGVLAVLEAAGLNIEYMYAFVERAADQAVLVFRFDNPAAAVQALQQAGIRVLQEADVGRL